MSLVLKRHLKQYKVVLYRRISVGRRIFPYLNTVFEIAAIPHQVKVGPEVEL